MLWLSPRTGGASSHDQEDVEADMHRRRQPLFPGELTTTTEPQSNIKLTAYTAGQQARNVTELLSLGSQTSVGSMLEQLDQQADRIQPNESICTGPFQVFRYVNNDMEAIRMSSPQSIGLGDLEIWDLVSQNGRNELNGDNLIDEIAQLAWTPGLCLPNEPTTVIDQQNTRSSTQQEPALEEESQSPLSIIWPSRTAPLDLEGFSMSTAKLLLDHYQNSMVNAFTPARVQSKSPWQTLYVPNVLSTLGEISLTGNGSNAKVSLLFAVFAISAFSLDITRAPECEQVSSDWQSLGNLYRERATKRLQLTLRDLSAAHKKTEKYKNILMPLLSMVTISVSFQF